MRLSSHRSSFLQLVSGEKLRDGYNVHGEIQLARDLLGLEAKLAGRRDLS
jgi:hypothetical protein